MGCSGMLHLQLFTLYATWQLILGQGIRFHRTTTGVAFSPFVKKSENGVLPRRDSETMQDVEAMLSIISTKFSKIATFGTGAKNKKYVLNTTYAEASGITWSAEAAARINKQRRNSSSSNKSSLTVLIGMWMSNFEVQMDSEFRLALESAKIANGIHPDTVPGLVLSHHELGRQVERTRQALEFIKASKNETNLSHRLKIGSRQVCHAGHWNKSEIQQLQEDIVRASDFIICEVSPSTEFAPSGASAGFETVGDDLIQLRTQFQEINSRIGVMGQTGWPSKGPHAWQNIDNLKDYWQVVDKWAADNSFPMWMHEAFDGPWKTLEKIEDGAGGHYGWWRLLRNEDANKVSGYANKIYEPQEEEVEPETLSGRQTANKSPWLYVGITVGIFLIVFVVALFAVTYFRLRRLQEEVVVSKKDIEEFRRGISEEAAAGGAGEGGEQIEVALKVPYDKSYEISKEVLKIDKGSVLGSGQFGCVYKAFIESEEKVQFAVALKMAKQDCPKTALKSLLSEIKILTYLGKHPNIVGIHGAYTAELEKGIVYVATEMCSLGSLEGFLRSGEWSANQDATGRYVNAPKLLDHYHVEVETNVSGPSISYQDMVRWSHEIACGMEYLGVKHVVHADLATRNVLLAADKTAKITDFGLSRRLYDYTNYVKQQQEPLPWRWMAFESLKRLHFSSKSDVWSYGVTLWEIFSLGDSPYPGLSWNLDFVDSLANGLRMKIPAHATPQIYDIMMDCWRLDPKERPTFTQLKLSTRTTLQ